MTSENTAAIGAIWETILTFESFLKSQQISALAP